ncbi:MAG: chorismate synthase [Candidatus Cryptobacteroides sp.]
MHNTFGNNIRITVFGGSHDPLMGVRMEGVPAGLPLGKTDLEADIARRKPGAKGTTPRIEADEPFITEGVADGMTTGGPLTIEFRNANTRPGDYSQFESVPRPGHVDYVTHPARYGVEGAREFPSFTGGGIFSGRVTLVIVAAGAVAKKMLYAAYPDVSINARLVSIGGSDDESRWQELIDGAVADGDSLGGVVECVAEGLPVGLGEPYFDSVESVVSHLIFSIPGVRGVEFGDGFAASAMRGSEHNDPFGPDGKPAKNGAGGVNGGLTNGAPLKFRVAFKPTSTIHKAQRTYDFSRGEMTELSARGRHDTCFALRTPVIVEAMTAIALANLI